MGIQQADRVIETMQARWHAGTGVRATKGPDTAGDPDAATRNQPTHGSWMKRIRGICTFRLITSEAELTEAFRLRFDVYRQTPSLRALLKENAAGLDIDGYDAYAWHCGIFKRTLNGDRMVGYLRVVVQHKYDWVEALVARLEQEYGFNVKPREATYYPDLAVQIGEALMEDGRFCEPCRFVILPEYRSTGLAKFAIEGVMALGFANPVLQVAVIGCHKLHRGIYEGVGFRWFAAQNEQPNAFQFLALYRSAVEKYMPDLPARMQQYRQHGAFVIELGQVDWGALRYLPEVLRYRARSWIRRLRRRGSPPFSTSGMHHSSV